MSEKLPFSLIIPAHNAENTIAHCLKAVFNSTVIPDEVIVVNDASTDKTAAIASQFDIRIIEFNSVSGPMAPRFEGAKHARYDLFVFIDADVIVESHTFENLTSEMHAPEITALTGMLDGNYSTGTFCGDFKNKYMAYIFSGKPRSSDFLYGSIWAIKRHDMLFFEPGSRPFGDLVSDSEMGMRLNDCQKKVILANNVRVGHKKPYSLFELLRNDYRIAFCFAQLLWKRQSFLSAINKRHFSHVSVWQAISTYLPLSGLAFILSGTLAASAMLTISGVTLVGLFYFYWWEFLFQLAKTEDLLSLLKACCLLPLSATSMGAGITSGMTYSFCESIGRER